MTLLEAYRARSAVAPRAADRLTPTGGMRVEVVRSTRRTRTISAAIRDGAIVVTIPARLSRREEEEWVLRMVQRVERAQRKSDRHGDHELEARAAELNRRYFEGTLTLTGIIYVDNQRTLFGSCTPSTGLIRISRRLAQVPRWVEDYVIVHELAHLVYGRHGARFWDLVNRYPLTERARGYLMALGLGDDEAGPEPGELASAS